MVDASTAMQGQGPSVHQGGQLVKMNLIITGTNPLATDMVTANIMGFQPEEISTFVWAWKAGLTLLRLDEIEVRGTKEMMSGNIFKAERNSLGRYEWLWTAVLSNAIRK